MAVKKILISQSAPNNLTQYGELEHKFGVTIDFIPFYLIEPLTSKELRTQKINIPDYTAIVFSARHTIDAFFKLCEELRIKVPETLKYFCTTEAVAMYLQKHIAFRKRKIFYGNGTPESVVGQIGNKHKDENFLITMSDTNNTAFICEFEKAGLNFSSAVFVKSVSQDLKNIDISSYDVLVVYNPADIKSLKENFPDEQIDARFVTYGKNIVQAMEEEGMSIEIQAPTPDAPSVAKALELYLNKVNV